MVRIQHSVTIAGLALLLAMSSAYAKSPKPGKSEYLLTTSAGFLMTEEEGVRYGLRFQWRKRPAAPVCIVAQFENPADRAAPLTVKLTVEPDPAEFNLESPRLTEITHDTRYAVDLYLYRDPDCTQRLGTHRQEVLFSIPPQYEAQFEQRFQIHIR